jgi:hypothetical protein
MALLRGAPRVDEDKVPWVTPAWVLDVDAVVAGAGGGVQHVVALLRRGCRTFVNFNYRLGDIVIVGNRVLRPECVGDDVFDLMAFLCSPARVDEDEVAFVAAGGVLHFDAIVADAGGGVQNGVARVLGGSAYRAG